MCLLVSGAPSAGCCAGFGCVIRVRSLVAPHLFVVSADVFVFARQSCPGQLGPRAPAVFICGRWGHWALVLAVFVSGVSVVLPGPSDLQKVAVMARLCRFVLLGARGSQALAVLCPALFLRIPRGPAGPAQWLLLRL